MLLWWGPDYVQLYNDHYAPILGTKHPDPALGKPLRERWREVYDIIGPLVDTPFYAHREASRLHHCIQGSAGRNAPRLCSARSRRLATSASH